MTPTTTASRTAEDPVPNAATSTTTGSSDGEEIALGLDPRNPDSDHDGVNDGDEYHAGTDPTQGVLPLTEENQLQAVGARRADRRSEWGELEKAILDQVNPGGFKGFLLGNPYYGVTLDKDGNFELLAYQENGIPVRGLLELLGVAGEEGGALRRSRAALAKLPAAAREALTSRGLAAGRAQGGQAAEPPSVRLDVQRARQPRPAHRRERRRSPRTRSARAARRSGSSTRPASRARPPARPAGT